MYTQKSSSLMQVALHLAYCIADLEPYMRLGAAKVLTTQSLTSY